MASWDNMECEKCPIRNDCPAYKQERLMMEASYHPQNVVQVKGYSCPLANLTNKRVGGKGEES